MKKKMLLGLLLATLLVTGCGKKDDYVKYETDLLEFKFEEYVVSSKGTIKDDYATVTFELDKKKIDDFKRYFPVYASEVELDDFNSLKGSNIYKELTDFCNVNNIDKVYQTFKSGEKVKTRDIYAILCNKDNKYSIYIAG